MEKLTDEQLKVLGTAIGKSVVESFCSKQEYWYGSKGWLSKIVVKFAETIVDQFNVGLQVDSKFFTSFVRDIIKETDA